MGIYRAIVFAALFALRSLHVVVGWQVYEATNNVYHLGLVGLAQFLAAFLATPFGGSFSDHHPRKQILTASLTALAVGFAALGAWSFWSGFHLLPLLLILFLIAGTYSFYFPASTALLPSLVSRERFSSAVAQVSTLKQLAAVLGPAAAGLLLPLSFGAPLAYAILALLLAVASALSGWLPKETNFSPKISRWSLPEFFAGFRYFWRDRILLGAATLDLFAVMLGGALVLLPAFTKEVLGAGAETYGFLRTLPALGSMATAFFLARFPLQRRIGGKLLGSVALYGLATIGLGYSTNVPIAGLCLVFIGALDMVSVVGRQTLMQIQTPEELRGRVGAVSQMSVICSNQLGEFESGLTAGLWGLVPAIVVGGVASIAITGIWCWIFPELRKLDQAEWTN